MRDLYTIYSIWATVGVASANSPQTKTIDLEFCRGAADAAEPGSRAAGRSQGNRAHAFRMTLVAQGKLPQKILSFSIKILSFGRL